MDQALKGVKVLDVSQVAAVPMAARHLADFGADVIHIERPMIGDMYREVGTRTASEYGSSINHIWENYNRNKRSLTVDLSQQLGQEIIYRLVDKVDVFVNNLRPFELVKFGLEYGELSRLNQRLVYGHLTGYGDKGAEKDRPGFDYTAYWARSGNAHMMQKSGGDTPVYPPGAFGDNMAALALAYGIMTALFARERTGIGQEVHVSLFQTGVYQISQQIAPDEDAVGKYEDRYGLARRDPPNPMVNLYQTQDGRWLIFMMLQPDRYWPIFCKAIEREELEHDPRFESTKARSENRLELIHILEECFQNKTLSEWRPRLTELPFDVVQTLPEVLADPQARANDFFIPYDHPEYGRIEGIASPINLSKTPATIRTAAPEFGQHTEEILLECGYNWEDIIQFKDKGVVS